MKISLVIPAYNEEKYIAGCLDSIQTQKIQPDEVIVVNNNSTDKTLSIVEKYPFVRVVNETTQGMIAARNAGFNVAQHDLIARCDADTKLPPNSISRVHRNFARYHIDALTGPIMFYDAPIKSSLIARAYLDMMKPIHRGGETLVGPNMIITKEIWEKVKNKVCLNDKLVHEDIDLAYHIQEVGGRIKRDNIMIVGTSSRRMRKNPYSFFSEYPQRFMKTLLYHDKTIIELKKGFKLPVWYTNRRFRKKS
ncbi:MAG: glycosyltransferase family 2 protein [Candidatus Roizmanbacteria bacterium]|nr:glycosyltransferase family 2 protein [Candidatus Roizmanbacteria bacterium]